MLAFACSPKDGGGDDTGAPVDTGEADTDTDTDIDADTDVDDTGDVPVEMVPVEITGSVLLGTERLVIGHDSGLAVYNISSLSKVDDLNLETFGQVVMEVRENPAGDRLLALPMCKTTAANSDFELPYAAGTENADKNLVAVLDITGGSIAVADTEIDINDDGVMDNGIDMDFYKVKGYIRSFNSTLPIPPVVFTGPQIAVGENLMFVRGSGIQGNGSDPISASGLGQVQDVGVFNLSTGHGVVLNEYLPWWNGLSAGDGTARWGITLQEQTSSVGWIEYLD
jgi:hypothetical protein